MTFTVYKCDHRGAVQLSYEGELLQRAPDFVCIRAIFQRGPMDLGYVVLKPGDIFTEWFYSRRWYNIFRVEDADSGQIKGFYCNLTRPAHIGAEEVRADDLALDVFVKPDGQILLLDEEEYQALDLSAQERTQVEQAVQELRQMAENRQRPFQG